jgi:alkylation response protein AidB-like acyl-CoA dehydrogenase
MTQKFNKNPRISKPEDDTNLAEEALRMGGASEEEIARTAAMDRSDDRLEEAFDPMYRTKNSPVHKAVWEDAFPFNLFKAQLLNKSEPCHASMQACLKVVRDHRDAGTLFDENDKVSAQVIDDLAKTGYWGMLIDKEYGGQGASIRSFASFLTEMSATGEPTTAGLASIHGCIGAVDPVRTYGTEDQKKYFLTKLAAGEAISGFALTEPGAGSDLTALRTVFTEDGDQLVINGTKLFISNAIEGRIIGLVGMMHGKDKEGRPTYKLPVKNRKGKQVGTLVVSQVHDEKAGLVFEDKWGRRYSGEGITVEPNMVPSVAVVELPKQENEHFEIVRYGLHALTHTYNNGLKFTNFRVPKDNLLHIENGDGLTIAYHGLNRGRVALCANAAGVMRVLLRSITPKSWGEFRKTYGHSIEKRELVQARVARLAGLIVGADALVAWCSSLLDEGYRGELECVVAKVFGSEAQKEAAIEIAMKTHGGRSFLKGHLVGDNIHDYLAPCIYEGEGQMLSMALFKSLAKEHGMHFMLPLGNGMLKLVKTLPKTAGVVGVLTLVLVLASLFTGSAALVAGGAAALLGVVLGFSQSALKDTGNDGLKGIGRRLAKTGVWGLIKGVAASAVTGAAFGYLGLNIGALIGAWALPVTAGIAGVVLGLIAAGHYGFIGTGLEYTLWYANKLLPRMNRKQSGTDRRLQKHLNFAQSMFRKLPLELSTAMVKHQLGLADRQCRINHMSQRAQDTITIAVTAQYAAQMGDEVTVMAADVLCQQLRMKLTGEQPSDAHFAACAKLAKKIVDGECRQLDGVPETPIMRSYEQS